MATTRKADNGGINSSELEFKVGDKVVYSTQGVGVITAVRSKHVGGQELNFYEISIADGGLRVSVPVRGAMAQGIRRIVDQDTVEKVYKILRERKCSVDTQTWNRRYRAYQQKLKSGSVFEIARVIRDLSVLKGDKELSFGERDMLKAARGRLAKEISIAKSMPEESIYEEIQEICQTVGPV